MFKSAASLFFVRCKTEKSLPPKVPPFPQKSQLGAFFFPQKSLLLPPNVPDTPLNHLKVRRLQNPIGILIGHALIGIRIFFYLGLLLLLSPPWAAGQKKRGVAGSPRMTKALLAVGQKQMFVPEDYLKEILPGAFCNFGRPSEAAERMELII